MKREIGFLQKIFLSFLVVSIASVLIFTIILDYFHKYQNENRNGYTSGLPQEWNFVFAIFGVLAVLALSAAMAKWLSKTDNLKSKQEKRNIENMVEKEQWFFTSILQAKNIVLIVIDGNNVITRINESLTSIFGDKFKIGENLLDVIVPKYHKDINDAIAKVRGNREMSTFSSVSDIRGREIHIDWTFAPFAPADAEDKHIAGIGFSMTDKFTTLHSFKENEEMLRLIMSHAQDAIIITDDEGNIFVANEAAEKLLGSSLNELYGRRIIPYVIPEEYEGDFLDDVQNGANLEIYAIHKSGKRLPIELSISRMNVLDRKNTLYVIRDATVRKQRETDMGKALDKARSAEKAKSEFLANMSHEIRTPLNGIIGFLNLLKHTKLDKTQMEYLHIINTSSESLLSIINDILDYSKVESGKMQLEKVEFNPTELFEQVTDLYAAKANEKGINLFVILDPKTPEWLLGDPLRLRQILSNLLSNAIKFTNSGGNVTVRVAVDTCDAHKCLLRISVKDTGIGIDKEKQAFIFEAFSQADSSVTRKYGGSGLGLAISVSIARLMGGNGLQIISDEGKGSEFYFNAVFEVGVHKGIPKPVFNDVTVALHDCGDEVCVFKKTVLEYFSALKCKSKIFHTLDDLKNIGDFDVICMGCRTADTNLIEGIRQFVPEKSTVYLTCDRNAGDLSHLESKTVRVINQPLNMSKFLDAFTFLIRKNTTITHDIVDKAPASQIFSGHVLVVEDNPVNRRLSDIILRQMGLTVELAINGKEGINLFLNNKFDIVFMDIHMPVLDGVEATKEIIRIEKEGGMSHTPIVALTANVIQEDRDSYLAAGMDGFLAKPIEKHKLEEVLSTFLCSQEHYKMLQKIGSMFEISDIEAVKHILNEFYKVAEDQIKQMRDAIHNKDIIKLTSIADSLKGAAMNLRFNNIVNGVKRIEDHVSKGNTTDYENIINDVEAELTHVKHIIG